MLQFSLLPTLQKEEDSIYKMTIFGRKSEPLAIFDDITTGLKEVYKRHLLPLEKEYKFHDMQSPMLEDPDFDGKPLVMLIGQYSTGKTTFIRFV